MYSFKLESVVGSIVKISIVLSMDIKLVAFGIAKEILKTSLKELSMPDHATIGELKNLIIDRYPEFQKLKSLRFAINEDYQEEDFKISEGDEVVIIPPVSGG